ncbi:hypothetical protein NUW58_g9844 [Xylaria curta]|uniref:Uncharacterized protein n=1 Tax=Xylaria curta TaxID=42375 RepID=A0ACC1MTF9_9PEZI|nr:hypothetical protein NUW58_g9844 [Xylaria curta]
MIISTLSPYLEFCWWLMLISFLATYYYAEFAISYLRPPKCGFFNKKMAKFAAGTTIRLGVQVVMLCWCLCITPFHVLVPTSVKREPLSMTEGVYDPGRSARIDVFAIHGLGSVPGNAWTYRSNETKVHWLSELLPQTMGFEDARIIMVNHQTRWASDAAPIQFNDHAYELLEHIESLHKTNSDRPIIFIAHSFGGLLLKKALILAKARPSSVAATVRGIIFLGVPHRGTYAAFLASCISCLTFFRGSSSSLHEFMSVDGPTILELESTFYDGYVIPYHAYQPQPYICDVIEMRSEQMGNLVLGPIVRQKYGLLRHGRIFTLDTDHRGLNKFYSHSDPNYVKLVGILLQAKTWALKVDPFLGLQRPKNEAPDISEFLSSGIP